MMRTPNKLIMITEEILIDEILQQTAKKCTVVIITSLPASEECNHKFSKRFEEKMQSLINGIGTNRYTITIQDPVISK